MTPYFTREGRGPAAVLLHGLGTSRHIWQPLTAKLAASHELVLVDLPGFGDSARLPEGSEQSPDALAASVAAVLDELGIAAAHLVGNSLGGWVALELAKRGRARSLALLSPAGLWLARPPRAGVAALRASHLAAHRATFDPRVRRLLSTSAGQAVALAPFVAHPSRVPVERGLAALDRLGTASGFLPTLRGLTRRRFTGGQALSVPVSVAFGSRDWMLPPGLARRRDELPEAVWWQTPRGWGHVPTYDDPQGVADFVLAATAR